MKVIVGGRFNGMGRAVGYDDKDSRKPTEVFRPPGIAYLFRCTGETTGQRHDHSVYGDRDKRAMDDRIAEGFAFCDCESEIRRVFEFQHAKSMPAHYNLAAGKYVESERELKEHYHVLSETVSERVNLPHDFQPVSQSERQALNVTSEGLAATVKTRDANKMRVASTVRKLSESDPLS